MNKIDVARIAHESLRAFDQANGIPPDGSWETIASGEQDHLLTLVEIHLLNPGMAPQDAHEALREEMKLRGSPIPVPFVELTEIIRVRCRLLRNVVEALGDRVPGIPVRA